MRESSSWNISQEFKSCKEETKSIYEIQWSLRVNWVNKQFEVANCKMFATLLQNLIIAKYADDRQRDIDEGMLHCCVFIGWSEKEVKLHQTKWIFG